MSTKDSNIKNWSTTPANNNATPPQGWPEGMAPSTVNDTARQQMADARYQWEDAEWFDWGDSVSRASATTFKIATDVTGRYQVDRRLKLFDSSNTLYGTITNSVYSAPDTTVTMDLDSGSLTASLTAVGVAILSPTNKSLPVTHVKSHKNLLINGDFIVAQRGTTFTAATTPANSDDTYLLDRWILLSDGNDAVDVSQETTAANLPSGSRAGIKLDVETANKKAGLIQIIENKDALAAIGRTASLSFKAKKVVGNATVDKLRAAVISWDSTADTVTSDVVSAWNAEGADPTLVANWTYENTPADITLTDSYQTFSIQGVQIDTASTTNIAVFIWIDNDDGTVGDLVYITDVQLGVGNGIGEFEHDHISQVLQDCQRYYEKTYGQSVYAGATTSPGVLIEGGNTSLTNATNQATPHFRAIKRTTSPTVTVYSYTFGATGKVTQGTGTDIAISMINKTDSGFYFTFLNTGGGYQGAYHFIAEDEL